MTGKINQKETDLVRRCMETALQAGADSIRLTLSKSIMDLVGTLNGEVDKVSHCFDLSLCVSIFAGGHFGTYSTNNLEEAGLDAFIKSAVEATFIYAEDPFRRLPEPERTATNAKDGNELKLYDPEYEAITPQWRTRAALGASIFKEYDIISEEGEYSDTLSDLLIMDSNGLFCRHTETSFDYGVEITVADPDGNKFSSYWWESTPKLSDFKIDGCAKTAYDLAVAQFGPKDIKSGKYNVVIHNKVAGKIVTPIFKALSGYSIQQNNSFLNDSVGKRIFSENLTIYDRCHSAGETGSRLFDSEGVATSVHPVVENGVVKEYFINTYIAGKLGMEPTIEDITRPHILPWPKAGMDYNDIMALCGEGILITDFNGGNNNSATGDFSYGFSGFYFKDGKIVHPVREMVVTGNLIRLWNNFVAAGEDSRLCKSKLIPTLAFSNVDISA